MINHNDSLDEALNTLESSPCTIAQAFCRKWWDELGMTMAEMEAQLGELEDAKREVSGLQDEIKGLEYEVEKLEKVEIELMGRIENCSQLLWRFRPNDCSRAAGQFGDEYDWIEYPEDIHKEYAPDYDEIQGAFVKSTDGELEEVWVLPKHVERYSKHAPYERVY